MKKILKKLTDIFNPKEFQGLDSFELLDSLNDPTIRKEWLFQVIEELRRMNLQVDQKLLSNSEFRLVHLCARRKAYQDVLESILSAKRSVRTSVKSHNPSSKADPYALEDATV